MSEKKEYTLKFSKNEEVLYKFIAMSIFWGSFRADTKC